MIFFHLMGGLAAAAGAVTVVAVIPFRFLWRRGKDLEEP